MLQDSEVCLGEVGLRQIRVTWQDIRLDLRQSVERLLAQTQMILDDLFRCQSQPLCDGDVVVNGGLKDLCEIELVSLLSTCGAVVVECFS